MANVWTYPQILNTAAPVERYAQRARSVPLQHAAPTAPPLFPHDVAIFVYAYSMIRSTAVDVEIHVMKAPFASKDNACVKQTLSDVVNAALISLATQKTAVVVVRPVPHITFVQKGVVLLSVLPQHPVCASVDVRTSSLIESIAGSVVTPSHLEKNVTKDKDYAVLRMLPVRKLVSTSRRIQNTVVLVEKNAVTD
ncbi:MAG: hypothetical protein AAGJ35_07630 [Myxococcota bacterium]